MMPIPHVTQNEILCRKQIKFAAAHSLPEHSGKCAGLHGHTFVLEIAVSGFVQSVKPGCSDSGMVMDFAVIGELLKRLHDECLDHKDLKNFEPYPTAERMVLRIWYLVCLWFNANASRLPSGVILRHIELYEEHVFPMCSVKLVNTSLIAPAPVMALPDMLLPDTPLCVAAEWATMKTSTQKTAVPKSPTQRLLDSVIKVLTGWRA